MTQVVTVIDYGSGNLRSVEKAFERVAEATGHNVTVSEFPHALAAASHIVLPGVGAFADCLNGLSARPGLREALEREVREKGKPFLGICVGMQLMAEWGREHGDHQGLGWIPGEVVRLTPADPALKVPHMGWNELEPKHSEHPSMCGIKSGSHAYFVHSYHFQCHEPSDVVATVDYGGPVVAAVARGNLWGAQFHPEKSQETGLRYLRNFLEFHS